MSATTQLVRTAHATSIAAVGRELAAVHRDMLRAGGDDAAVRLSVLNLVIACAAESDTDDATAVIERIAARHPARVIMLVADPDAPAAIEADISLQCSAVGGREQVCAEVVRLRVGGESALHLVSVVTPLLLADVPVDLWLAGAARLDQALGDEALAACERLIVDTGAYSDPRSAIGMLARATAHPNRRLDVADIAWTRTALWRQLVAQAFDAAAVRPFVAGVERAVIATAGAPGAEALLLGAWLRSRLDRPGCRIPEVELHGRNGGGEERGSLLAVRLQCRRDGAAATIEVTRASGAMSVLTTLDGGPSTANTVPAPTPSLAELVGALLADPGADLIYLAAVQRAAQE